MKLKYISIYALAALCTACSLDEPDTQIQDTNHPYRLQIDEEGTDLADAEDYGIEISFADYLGDLPTEEITLTYELIGEGDFSGVAIDEVIYEYEDDDCVFEREVAFTSTTISIPVDADMGTVPAEFEIVVAFGLAEGQEATEGGFTLVVTDVQGAGNVVFNASNEFQYEILDNDAAGAWVIELDEPSYEAFQEVFGAISPDLSALEFAELTGEVTFEFEFEEMKIEIVLQEEEEVTECENGEVETGMENRIMEIEAEYGAEDGELTFEGSYFNEDGEELDFIIEASYTLDDEGNLALSFTKVVDEDHFEAGDELYAGSQSFHLTKD